MAGDTRGRTWKRCGTRGGTTPRKTSAGYTWKDQRKNGGQSRNWAFWELISSPVTSQCLMTRWVLGVWGQDSFGWTDRSVVAPDHEDLLTSTDNEVLYRLVGRWVGQDGKATLVNTTDADILEYILTKLTARITDKSRTFLVKVKAHREESLNEGTDDLAEAGHTLTMEGQGYRW